MPLPRLAVLLAFAVLACDGAAREGDAAVPGNTPAAATAANAGADADTVSLDPLLARADSSRIAGAETAGVWMLEISDYQCPYCKSWHDETYPAILRDYVQTGKVRIAYVNFPLPMHQHARITAEAAMCAGAQQQYWRYHDGLFATQARWAAMPNPRPLLDSLARASQIDVAAFGRCLDGGTMRPVVDADVARMEAAGIRSTPTFLIGDQRIEGAAPLADFRKVLDAAVAAARPSAPAP